MLKFKHQWDEDKLCDASYIVSRCIAASTKSSRIFIYNWVNQYIYMYDLHGTFICNIGNVNVFGVYDPNSKPYIFNNYFGMYIDDINQELFIPDLCSIKVFDLQGRHLRSIQTTIDDPRTLYCSYNGDKIFVGYSNGFQVYNGRTGYKLVNKYSFHKDNVDINIGDVNGLAYNNITREVFIYDSINIIVVDEYGEFKRILELNRCCNINYGHQLCIDELNNILFVIDAINQCVSIIRCSDGSLLYNIYMNDIRDIYYDSTSQYLYMHNSHTVKVYSYNES